MAVADVLTTRRPRAAARGPARHSPRWPPRSPRSRRPPARRASRRSCASCSSARDPLTAKGIVKVLGGDLRIGLREGLVEAAIAKAFDRPLDDVKWAGMLVGDVGRAGRRSPATTRLDEARARAVPPAQVHARLAGRGRGRDPRRGSARRSGSRTSTTASAPSSTSAGRDVRLYWRDLHDVSSRLPGGRRGAPRSLAVGRHPRRRDPRPGATAWCCRSSRSRPGSGASRRRPRSRPRSRSSSSPSTCSRSGPAATPPVEPLLRVPLTERRARLDALDLPAATRGGRFARSHLIVADDVDALEAASPTPAPAATRA